MAQGSVKKIGKRSLAVSAKKEAILAAALDAFSQFGIHGTRLEQVAELAGVSKTNLLYYYPSKEGMWPGDDYFASRYDYLTEYVQVLRDLWGTGRSDFKGDYFTMNDCRVSPQPSQPMKVICAGQSDAGMAFSAQHADYNFCFGKGVNTPAAFAPTAARMMQAAEKTGRDVGSYVLFMVIADETDEAARAKWEHYKAGADDEALAWLTEQSQKDTRSGSDTNVRQMADPTSAVNINMGTLVGSYASVARMLDEVAAVPGTDGVLLTFDDFLIGIEAFGQRIQPLMRCRDHIATMTQEVA